MTSKDITRQGNTIDSGALVTCAFALALLALGASMIFLSTADDISRPVAAGAFASSATLLGHVIVRADSQRSPQTLVRDALAIGLAAVSGALVGTEAWLLGVFLALVPAGLVVRRGALGPTTAALGPSSDDGTGGRGEDNPRS